MTIVETHVFRENNGEIEFLIIKRRDSDTYGGIWQMVTGTREGNEKAYETAIREVKEETGCEIERFWVVPNINLFYSAADDRIISIPVFMAKVNKKNVIKLSPDHSEFKWVSAEDAKRYFIWEGQRKSVDVIMQYLTLEGDSLKFTEITENNNIKFT